MSKRDDESLGSTKPVDADDSIEDATPEPEPESYDVGSLVAGGVIGTRVRVKVQPNGHLLADLQGLAEQIDAYPADDDVPEDLIEQWIGARAEFDHVDTYVVSGRTTDWLRSFAGELQARGEFDEFVIQQGMVVPAPSKGQDPTGREYAAVMRSAGLAQIAAQSERVDSFGQSAPVAVEDLAALYESSEPEADKLFRAVRSANTQPVKALTPDFSRRVSRLSQRG